MTIELYSIQGNSWLGPAATYLGRTDFKGLPPDAQPDDKGLVRIASNALLLRFATGPFRNVLFDTGIGNFFNPAIQQKVGIENRDVLGDSLAERGLTRTDIDAVFLTHLHNDHVGGLLTGFEEGASPRLNFPNAKFVVGSHSWVRARSPEEQDKRSFLPYLPKLLSESGRLVLLKPGQTRLAGLEGVSFAYTNGHTPGLMIPMIQLAGATLVFGSDLFPARYLIKPADTMGYDLDREQVSQERWQIMSRLPVSTFYYLYHDTQFVAARVLRDAAGQVFKITEGHARLDGELRVSTATSTKGKTSVGRQSGQTPIAPKAPGSADIKGKLGTAGLQRFIPKIGLPGMAGRTGCMSPALRVRF